MVLVNVLSAEKFDLWGSRLRIVPFLLGRASYDFPNLED